MVIKIGGNQVMKNKDKMSFNLILLALALCFGLLASKNVHAVTKEVEPNDTVATAQKINLGEKYTGLASYDKTGDVDYYKFSVKEGNFYKIDVTDIIDLTGKNWKTLIVQLYKANNTNSGYTILNGDYRNSTSLFRASYTGSYYLKFHNAGKTSYTFAVSKFNPKGLKVKDSDSNTYRITGNYTMEFSKAASKNNSSFYFNTTKYFSDICGMDVLDYYDTPFTVNSIGKYAFKNCKITSISIPEEIKTIGVGAFMNCKKLGYQPYIMGVVIRGKKVVIKSKAFNGCSKLESVRVIKKASVKSVAKNAFKGSKKGIRLEVPNIKKYKKLFKNAGFKKPKYSKSYL